MVSVLTVQDNTVKVSFQNPWKLSIFQFYTSFFHLPLPAISQAQPNQDIIFEINEDRSISSKSIEHWYWKL